MFLDNSDAVSGSWEVAGELVGGYEAYWLLEEEWTDQGWMSVPTGPPPTTRTSAYSTAGSTAAIFFSVPRS